MAGLDIDPMGGILTLTGSMYQLPNHAVTPYDYGLSQLWDVETVGANREVADGHVTLTRRVKQQTLDVPLLIIGEAKADGTAQTGGVSGIWINYRALQAAFITPTLSGGGAIAASFVPFTGGPTLTGNVQGDGLTVATRGVDSWTVLLHLLLPGGPLS